SPLTIAPLRGAPKHSHRAYRRCRGADRAGEAEGRGGEEGARAAMGAQRVGERGGGPGLSEVGAGGGGGTPGEGEGGAGGVGAGAGGMRLDGVIVRDERDEAAVRHPLLQLLVAPIEHAAGICEALAVGLSPHLEDEIVETGPEADEIARLYHNLVLVED